MEYASNGRMLHLVMPRRSPYERPKPVKREAVKEFTQKSRLRLLTKINSIDRLAVKAEGLAFVTLTYPRDFATPRASKKHLNAFLEALRRSWGPLPLFWKLEPQRRGAPHYHLLVNWCRELTDALVADLVAWVSSTWFRLVGAGDVNHLRFHRGELPSSEPCVSRVVSWDRVTAYVGKYLGKVVDPGDVDCSFQHPGRFWGVRNAAGWIESKVILSCPEITLSKIKRLTVRMLQKKRLTIWMAVHRRDGRPLNKTDDAWWFAPDERLICPDEPAWKREPRWRRACPGASFVRVKASFWNDFESSFGKVYHARPIKRPWRLSSGGLQAFVESSQVERMIAWACAESGVDLSELEVKSEILPDFLWRS